ncbi:MAG: DNA-directed RNA polymerase subunit omega [Microcoleaceae cyanobacterium]
MSQNVNLNPSDLHRRTEEVIQNSQSRYQVAIQVAKRAKRFRYEGFDNPNYPGTKPILRAIIEMSDELTQPELIVEYYHLLS